jgi:hypothetical protein
MVISGFYDVCSMYVLHIQDIAASAVWLVMAHHVNQSAGDEQNDIDLNVMGYGL